MASSIFDPHLRRQLINLFRRTTSSGNFIEEIDGFRFFAIFSVLVYHLNTHLSRNLALSGKSDSFENSWLFAIASQGGIGVNVFFAISGFVLALPFAKYYMTQGNPVSLRSYFIRRVTRLEPPYVLSLILLFLVQIVLLHESFKMLFPNFLASLFYLHSFIYDKWSKINPVAWSLEVEVQFYILAPLLALIFRIRDPKWRRGVLVTLMIVSVLHAVLNIEMIKYLHLRKSIIMHLHQFLVGFLFVDFYLTDWKDSIQQKSYAYDIIGVVSFAMLFVFNDPFEITHGLLFISFVFVAFFCLFKGKVLNAFFTNTWITIIGGMCYSIYLLHYAMIAFLMRGSKGVIGGVDGSYWYTFFINALVYLPVVLIVSAVFYLLIEKPCMDKQWPSKFVSFMKNRLAQR